MPQLDTNFYIKDVLAQSEWMENAACIHVDPTIFFPYHEDKTSTEAKQHCNACSVQELCLEYAIKNNIQHGIWGGLGVAERKRLKRQREKKKQCS